MGLRRGTPTRDSRRTYVDNGRTDGASFSPTSDNSPFVTRTRAYGFCPRIDVDAQERREQVRELIDGGQR